MFPLFQDDDLRRLVVAAVEVPVVTIRSSVVLVVISVAFWASRYRRPVAAAASLPRECRCSIAKKRWLLSHIRETLELVLAWSAFRIVEWVASTFGRHGAA